MMFQLNRLRCAKLPARSPAILLWALGWFAVPVLAPAQSDDSPQPPMPPESAWPASSHYYEARITPEGYALYIPFFIPREAEPADTGSVKPPWREDEPRRPTERDPVGAAGRFELRTREEVIPGEFIQVYRPAVYEIDEDGELQLLQSEKIVTLPKVRIVMERVWVSGLSSRDLMPGPGGEPRSPRRGESPDAEASQSPKEPEMAK